jgi:putative ABC transport system permease protein
MAASNSTVLRILWSRFAWRHWRQSPVSSLLLLFILSIGVAAFFSIRLANRAAVASFEDFTGMITSQSDGIITAPAGTLPETVLTDLRQLLGNAPVNLVPVLETSAILSNNVANETLDAGPTFQLLGLDLPALVNVSGQSKTAGGGSEDGNGDGWFGSQNSGATNDAGKSTSRGWRDSRSVFITDALAQRDGLKPGSPLPLVINEHRVELRVAGIIPATPNQPAPPADLLVMDLPELQQLTDKTGRLDRVEVVLEEGPERAAQWARIKAQLEAASPADAPRWVISAPADRRAGANTMTRAFRLNLTILSLLALLVGLYLVFQGLDGAVVRRRNEIAVLRSLGVTSQQIQGAWLVEAAVIGLAGGFLGLGLGWLGAQLAVKLVGRTVNALYFATTADSAPFSFGEAAVALVLAVAASTVAGWRPARIAANTPPAQVATRGGAAQYPGGTFLRRPDLGLLLVAFGILLTALPPVRMAGGARLPVAGYAAGLFWLMSGGIFAGSALAMFGKFIYSLKVNSLTLRLAGSHLRAPSGRHRLAVASVVCAVGMTAGMAILVGSFDTTMRGWISRTFQADLYVSSDGAQNASSTSRISPATWQRIVADPAIQDANVIQIMEIKLGDATTLLVGNRLSFFRDYAKPAWVTAPLNDDVFDPGRNEGLALASESFSERFHLQRGDSVRIPVAHGYQTVTIAGIFADYGNERGSLLVERQHFARWYGDELAASVILVVKPGHDPMKMWGALHAEYPGLNVFTSSFLRTEILRVFHQTFAVTYALELIGIVVAIVGLALTMASLLWERRIDLNTLRALGLRRHELANAAALEGALTAAAGLLMGLAVSVALGWLLIFRINKQTFGWTLQTDRPWLQLTALALLVLASATVVGWLVGRWAARLPAEREEE